ncbi:MAG TPA: hypothetical protein VFW96_26345 [Thermomicrobiales bacterium]|nr:hypothetical protein [Thermomicrobiales bacterium]
MGGTPTAERARARPPRHGRGGRWPAALGRWRAETWAPLARALTSPPTLLLLLLVLPALILAYQFPRTRAIAMGGDGANLCGFYAPERGDEGQTFRWSGPEGQVVLPGAVGNAAWTATLRVSGARGPGVPPPAFDVLADGRPVARFQASTVFQDYTVRFRRPAAASRDLTLSLRAAPFRPAGDRRELGLAVARVTLAPARATLPLYLPPPYYAAVVLALFVMGAAALGGLGAGRRAVAALVGGGLAATLAGVGLAPDATARALPVAAAVAAALLAFALARGGARALLAGRGAAVGAWCAARAPLLLVGILIAGLALRLALAPFGAYRFDTDDLGRWTARLATVPLARFYDGPPVDHLPGDLWVMWALGKGYALVSPGLDVQARAFLVLLKLVPALADAGIAALLYLLGRRLGGAVAGLVAAALYAFNPGSVFLTAVWGQWDALSAALALAALWLLLRGDPEWAFPVLAYAALIKPQVAALAPLLALAFVAWYALREPPGRWLRRVAVGAAASLLVLVLVPLPFDVGVSPLPARWSLVGRLSDALEKFTETSHSAFNLWTAPLAAPAGVPLFRQPDSARWLLGLTYQAWGALLLAAALVAILAAFWRRRDARALVWAATATALALFVLPTRIHERYLLPAVALAALAAALAPRLGWLYAGLTLTYLANLYYVYAEFYPIPKLAFMYSSATFVHAMSLLNLALLAWLGLGGLRALAGAEKTAGGRRQTAERIAAATGAATGGRE